jgi:preprotein translocase subunit SecE
MKRLKTTIIVILVALFFSMGIGFADEKIPVCPNGKTLDLETIYSHWLPPDFPKELLYFFCAKPCVENFMGKKIVIEPIPMSRFSGHYLTVTSLNGRVYDSLTFYAVWCTQSGHVVAVVSTLNNEEHKVLWVSKKEAPKGLREYLDKVIGKLNKINDENRF